MRAGNRPLGIPRHRAAHAMRARHPTSPVERERDVFTRALDISGDTLDQQPHHLLALPRAALRRLPQRRDVVGSMPEGLALRGGPRRGLLPLEPRLCFLPLVCRAACLCPEARQRACHQAVCRFPGGGLPGRPLGAVARPLSALLPMRRKVPTLRSLGVCGGQAERSRRRLAAPA